MKNYVSVDDTDKNPRTDFVPVPETNVTPEMVQVRLPKSDQAPEPERFPAGVVLVRNRSQARMITNRMPADRIIVRGDRRYRVDAKGTWRRIKE